MQTDSEDNKNGFNYFSFGLGLIIGLIITGLMFWRILTIILNNQ
jgi:uncharacterized membrane protein YciS (DUF1049 family)